MFGLQYSNITSNIMRRVHFVEVARFTPNHLRQFGTLHRHWRIQGAAPKWPPNFFSKSPFEVVSPTNTTSVNISHPIHTVMRVVSSGRSRHFEKGRGGRECICPVLTCRKCTQWIIVLLFACAACCCARWTHE